jgi:hypothetical protein
MKVNSTGVLGVGTKAGQGFYSHFEEKVKKPTNRVSIQRADG